MTMGKPRYGSIEGSIFEALATVGHDEDFEPLELDGFEPKKAMPGSDEKIYAMAKRVELELPIFHKEDAGDCMVPRISNVGTRKKPHGGASARGRVGHIV